LKPDVLPRWIQNCQQSLADGTFIRLLLSGPSTEHQPTQRITGRCVQLRGETHLQVCEQRGPRAFTRNLALKELAPWLHEQLPAGFRNALLQTTKADWQLTLSTRGHPTLRLHPPAATQAPVRTHDQPRASLLDDTARDWLHALGFLAEDGRVRASMSDKHRQIHHYLEILSHLARECGWGPGQTPPRSDSPWVDVGCGKGYLTFGAWQLLHRAWQLPVRVIGVESRPDLVAFNQSAVQALGADNIEFMAGDIGSVQLPRLGALIALHACDTATDLAILRGIAGQARLIIVAPCCHHELRPQLGKPAPFDLALSHGLLADRFSEWLTDTLRTLHLEAAGYQTKVQEFIGSSHTPKNLMIAAIRRDPDDPGLRREAAERIRALSDMFNIRRQTLQSGVAPASASNPSHDHGLERH
jgi:SAM-dependent methyltransferase